VSNQPTELHPDDRKKLARVLGMKPSEIIAAAELPDADPDAAVVQTHDGQHVLVTTDQDGKPVVTPWDGPMPGAPVEGDEPVLVGEQGPELRVQGGAVVDPNASVDEDQGDGEVQGGAAVTGGEVPAGTVDEVLAWVGADKDRAARALVVEQDTDKPRKGLVDQLRKLAGQA